MPGTVEVITESCDLYLRLLPSLSIAHVLLTRNPSLQLRSKDSSALSFTFDRQLTSSSSSNNLHNRLIFTHCSAFLLFSETSFDRMGSWMSLISFCSGEGGSHFVVASDAAASLSLLEAMF
jgi:hypothetical protein